MKLTAFILNGGKAYLQKHPRCFDKQRGCVYILGW